MTPSILSQVPNLLPGSENLSAPSMPSPLPSSNSTDNGKLISINPSYLMPLQSNDDQNDVEIIQIQKRKVPLLHFEQNQEENEFEIAIKLEEDKENNLLTPRVKKTQDFPLPGLKPRPKTSDLGIPQDFFSKKKAKTLKNLKCRTIKPYIASKTFRGSQNFLSPRIENPSSLKLLHQSPEFRKDFIEKYESSKTSRGNLFNSLAKSSTKSSKIKILPQKLFPDENIQKLSDLVLTEFQVNCKFVPFIQNYFSFKRFFSESLLGCRCSLDNVQNVLCGIPLVFGKKRFTKRQIAYIEEKTGLDRNQVNLSVEQFCLVVYKAYKVALFKKS
jgi:hypothetical protein